MRDRVANLMIFIIMFSFIFSVILTTQAEAAELSLESALEWGKDHNIEIRQQKEAVEKIERELASIDAGLDWQASFAGSVSHNKGSLYQTTRTTIDPNNLQDEGEMLKLSLNGDKIFISGLTIDTDLTLNEVDPFDLERMTENYQLSFNISKRFYPIIPTKEKKSQLQVENNFKKAEAELESLQKEKEIDWVAGYLNLLYLQDNKALAQERLELAKQSQARIKKIQAIGEAGERQILTSELNLKEAVLNLKQAENNYAQQVEEWYLDLGLEQGSKVNLSRQDNYLTIIKKMAGKFDLDFNKEDELIKLASENDSGLKALKGDLLLLKKELKWLKDEGRLNVDAFGGCDHNKNGDDWQIGLGISYDFMDGGKQRLNIADKEAEIVNYETKYQHNYQELEQRLNKLINELRTAELNLEAKSISLEKCKLEDDLFKRQCTEGMITNDEYQEKIITFKQTEIEHSLARDSLLISNLRLLQFLGLY